ncbi:ABC transporter permease [Psychroflexus tropicus]|uniref:ABC transporter permease n=1 Tax=Psychroflexus tropicus TaxID=197345 RepID=UPI0003824A80|nr:FtsX-like permease family protein [Psychroflexus tropicus]
MAWRDARASRVRLFLFMASIVLGIAAVVSIQLFGTNLKDNIQKQSKALMGADYIIDSDDLPNERAQEIIDSLQPQASEVNFVSMVAFPKNGNTKLVKVRGLEGEFPFYGSIDTEPKSAAEVYQKQGGALVDATLMLQFDIQPGDSIKIGELTLPIAGALKAIPGSTAISTSVAPPVLMPRNLIDQTELIQFGSRKEYQYFFKVSDSLDLEAFEDQIDPQLDAEEADLDTHTSTSQRLGRRYENVGNFLNLAAFIALLLGCIGIASSVHIYIKEKLKSIAVLKCMGASRRQSFIIFLLQIAGIGFIGGLIGSIIGVGLQKLFPIILQEFLPFDVEISIAFAPILMGVILGVLMSVLFALLPLLSTWYVSPLEVLRVTENKLPQPQKARILVFSTILVFLYFFSFWLLDDALYALGFIGGTLVTFSILAGIAIGVMNLIRNYFPKGFGYTTRQSLLNLFRPNNQTVVLVVTIGLGTFLISTLYFTKDILLEKTNVEQSTQNANLILLDIQSDQRDAVAETLTENEAPILDNIPIVTMRVQQINDKTANAIRKDTTSTIRGWVLNHEFRTTYRDQLTDSEEVVKGEWVSTFSEGETVPISISENFAEDAKVGVGDALVFNVQGVLKKTQVKSIRKIDWGALKPNFNILFPSGVLEKAPQFDVITTAVANEEASANLQRDLVAAFPNLTVIDLRQVYSIIEDILNKVSWVINFMAFFSILTGIIVLIGSVRTSKYQRIKESVLLRTLGAKNTQILKISALEYVFLGLLGSLVGIVLALVSSLCLALFVFEQAFVPSWIPFGMFLPGISLLVVLIGLSNIQSVLRSSPLEVLRKEA